MHDDYSDLVEKLSEKQNISISELARRIGQSRQNFSKRLKGNTLTIEEPKEIADALDVTLEQSFALSGGTQLKNEN